jgi:lysophospholipid acyltransferase (LPLAT)-like uncharacterized protein
MVEFKLPTPFANVKIVIEDNDTWAKDEIKEWIFHKCGLSTEEDFQEINLRFECAKMKSKILSEA